MAIFREPDLVKFSELFSVNFDKLRQWTDGALSLEPSALSLERDRPLRAGVITISQSGGQLSSGKRASCGAREALINSQSQIIRVFSCNTAS